MTTNLGQRLRSADPVGAPTDEQAAIDRAWLSAKVKDTVLAASREGRSTRTRRSRVVLAAAAAAVVAGAGIVASGALSGGDQTHPVATPPPMELTLGSSSPTMGSCIRFSVEDLSRMPVAFSGTVVRSADDQILVDVDHWYRGGDADQVSLVAPDGSTVSLEGTLDFAKGYRYLLTATGGTINYCGFSALWSQEMSDAFAAAFPSG